MQYFCIIFVIFFYYKTIVVRLFDNTFVFLWQSKRNMNVLDKEQTYFEEHASELLESKGISKAQFAKEMGVVPQNINKLFGTKNFLTLCRVSSILGIPLDNLMSGEERQRIQGCVFVDGIANLIKSKDDLEKLLKKLK